MIALVGCGKAKLDRAAPAKDLYTGNLFRAGRDWAEENADEWFILSALHGVIHPVQVVAPYDLHMGELSRSDKWAWGMGVRKVLKALGVWPHPIVFLAGSEYEGAVLGAPHVDMPLRGLMMGERLRWYKENRGRQRSFR